MTTARSKGQSRYEAWYKATWKSLYRFAYARVQNREEAEDLTQEVYSRALARGGDEPPDLPYLLAMTLNLIRDRWRRRRSRGDLLPLEEKILQATGEDDAATRAWVRELMSRLPEEYRTVLELRLVQGYSRTEVARQMNKTEDAVRGLQYRALQTLRDMIRADL